jgi:hypothetical protein
MRKKTKKYFDGGSLLSGTAKTAGTGMGVVNSAMSGDAQGVMSGAVDMNMGKLKQFEELNKLNQSGLVSGGQNIASVLATSTGLGDMLNPLILGNAQEQLANRGQDSLDIIELCNLLENLKP